MIIFIGLKWSVPSSWQKVLKPWAYLNEAETNNAHIIISINCCIEPVVTLCSFLNGALKSIINYYC